MFKQIIAHRGESIDCPENTIPSFEKAFALGADGIECDLQLTKDNVGVIFHDRTLEKKTGEKAAVADLSFAELRRKDLGSWKSAKWAGITVATIEETLAVIPDSKVVHVELKCGHKGIDVFAKALENTAIAESQIILTGFKLDIGETCKRLFPNIPFLLNGLEFDYDQVAQSSIDGVATYYNHDIIEQVLGRNLKYRMGNINTREEIDAAHQHGVEYIDTDDVAYVVDYCRNTRRDAT
jgi:glycerophosphoryl diester phosphodiesterase